MTWLVHTVGFFASYKYGACKPLPPDDASVYPDGDYVVPYIPSLIRFDCPKGHYNEMASLYFNDGKIIQEAASFQQYLCRNIYGWLILYHIVHGWIYDVVLTIRCSEPSVVIPSALHQSRHQRPHVLQPGPYGLCPTLYHLPVTHFRPACTSGFLCTSAVSWCCFGSGTQTGPIRILSGSNRARPCKSISRIVEQLRHHRIFYLFKR